MDIINFKEINKGCLQAKFDVSIAEWGLVIREVTLFEKEGRKWLGMPNRQYTSKEGQSKSFDLVFFDKNTRPKFQKAVIEKIQSGQVQAAKQNQNNEKPMPF